MNAHNDTTKRPPLWLRALMFLNGSSAALDQALMNFRKAMVLTTFILWTEIKLIVIFLVSIIGVWLIYKLITLLSW